MLTPLTTLAGSSAFENTAVAAAHLKTGKMRRRCASKGKQEISISKSGFAARPGPGATAFGRRRNQREGAVCATDAQRKEKLRPRGSPDRAFLFLG